MFPFCSLGAVVGAAVLALPTAATAAPCQYHKGKDRQACIAHRDAQAFPKGVTWKEALDRLTPYEEATLLRIGLCEMGTQRNDVRKWGVHGPRSGAWATLRWGLNLPRYSTAFGIWNGNGAYIRQATGGYAFPGRTPAEELLGAMALADGPARGFSGWGCF